MGRGCSKIKSDRILFFVFLLAVFIDAVNGVLQKKVGITTPIGIIYRGGVFIYLFPYLFRNKYKRQIVCFILFVLLCLLLWVVFYGSNPIKEAEWVIRYSYFFVFLNYFCLKRDSLSPEIVFKYILRYGLFISSIIILCYFTDSGIKSYGEGEYGWGEKGFFIATNDIGLTILCSLICSCIYYNAYCEKKGEEVLSLFIVALGGILVGSRVCFFFIPFTLLLFILYKARRTRNKLVVIIVVSLICYAAIYVGYEIYQMFDDYALARLTRESFENARTILTDEAKKHIANFDILGVLIGKGADNLHNVVGKGLGIDGERAVEADYYEIVGSYGYFLGGIIIFFYLKIAIRSFIYFYEIIQFRSFCIMYMFLSFILIAYFAGHAVTNMMATPILAYIGSLLLAPRRKYVNWTNSHKDNH